MRAAAPAVVSIAMLLLACGGHVEGIGSEDEASAGLAVVSTSAWSGGWSSGFDVNLQKSGAPSYFCPESAPTLGGCCYFAPPLPGSDPLPGSGTPATESNAGTLTLSDVSSSSLIGTFGYSGGGYNGLPVSYAGERWHPGDVLEVSATGDQIGVFSISAPALIPPSIGFPSVVSKSQDLELSWEPDGNAETMALQIVDGSERGTVACAVSDSMGSLTVDASLFSAFESGDDLSGGATRVTARFTQTSKGSLELESLGDWGFRASVE